VAATSHHKSQAVPRPSRCCDGRAPIPLLKFASGWRRNLDIDLSHLNLQEGHSRASGVGCLMKGGRWPARGRHNSPSIQAAPRPSRYFVCDGRAGSAMIASHHQPLWIGVLSPGRARTWCLAMPRPDSPASPVPDPGTSPSPPAFRPLLPRSAAWWKAAGRAAAPAAKSASARSPALRQLRLG